MKRQSLIDQKSFDRLLEWLDPDRERAGSKYEAIRVRLIKIFTCRGCSEAEDLADETINRVIFKIESLLTSYQGDPALYFYGVAQKIHLEYLRRRVPRQIEPIPAADEEDEPAFVCLEDCMKNLPPDSHRLVLEYYKEEKKAKIEHRRMLAEELGIAVNALRIRAHRIRLQLQNCVKSCMDRQPAM